MNTDDPMVALTAITDSGIPIIAIVGLSIVANWVAFIGAARMSRRSRIAPMAPPVTAGEETPVRV